MKNNKTLVVSLLFTLVFGGSLIGYCLGYSVAKPKHETTEYQFNVDNTGYDILDNGKQLGRLNYGNNPSLDSLIDFDNQ